MSIVVLIELQVKPEAMNEVNAVLRELLPDTRAYDGCLGLDIHRNMDQAGNLMLYQRWASREQYRDYLAWRTRSGVVNRLRDLLQTPPSARHFERMDL